jgi:hypothetical protein
MLDFGSHRRFAGTTMAGRARWRMVKKNYAPDSFTGASAAPSERKTCESVPTDSRTRRFGVRIGRSAAPARARFSIPIPD